ncbi:2Fe-2S iron-sulfur cluster binding domain-containing protein [Serratia inhibens]|uniref:2Fe-2S iron-sulfur cluster binding domain-containing protein n=1 Tax=Serratia inhibens TaxID=2338073 RepID=UPI00025E4D47|nr:2Fe-2S iron-sulfur cluster binding domain-containing protein [Serratia inhibens]ANS41646.1 Xylene monooxygenase electron transfer component [Serratia inhibens PRI-2C]
MLKRWFSRRSTFQGMLEGQTFTLAAGETVLESALKAGVALPYNCQVGSCKSCLCRVVSGEVRSLVDLGYLLSAEEIAAGHVLACQCLPQSDLTLMPATVATHWVPAQIKQATPLSASVWRITLSPEQAMPFLPGQFFQLCHQPDTDVRSYSVSWPSSAREIVVDVTLREQGRLSPFLCDRNNIGRTLWLSGGSGQFGQADDGKGPLLAIASGSGLGTTLGLVRAALARNPYRAVMLVHAIRKRQDKFDVAELQRLQQQHQGFHYLHALSQESEGHAHELAGRFTSWLEAWRSLYPHQKYGLEAHGWRVLICGNPGLAQACQRGLPASGVMAQHIQTDCFSPAGAEQKISNNKELVC